jgi:nitroreductase
MQVLEAIRTRRSVRSYSPRPLPPEVLERLREALRAAPSACNLQPWHFIFVTDAGLRRKLAEVAQRQLWLAEAPVIVAACGFPEQAAKAIAGYRSSAEIDVAIALDHLSLAAVAEGLGTCWIGAFHEERVKLLLDVPPAAKVVALMPVGYPASPGLNLPLLDGARKPADEIFSTDRYGQT